MAGHYVDLANKKRELIRKQLEGSVFIADADADAITSLTTLTNAAAPLKVLPAGYDDLGLLTKDGARFSQGVTTSDVTSWGDVDPTRSDVTAKTTSLQVACQETNIRTIGLYVGADLSAIDPPVSGEVSIEEPVRPATRYYRVLALGVDLTEDGELYIGRFLPKASVTNIDDQAFSDGDDPTLWGVTLSGKKDDTLGYAHKWMFGGPAWSALLTDMGFPAAAVGP